jgi:uncharacterized membrane protein HdeD (DUF308 family)
MNSQATGASEAFRTPGSMPVAMSAPLARNWWAVALRGVLGIVVGLIALAMPAATMLAFVLLLAHATVTRSTI